jgi:hypothetical protein
MHNIILRRFLILALLALHVATAWGQWSTQTIPLQPGWNAVFLEVQPQPSDCDTVFANVAVESAWGWNRKFSAVQFIQNASSLVPLQPDWLFYVPATNLLAGERSLFNLEGGKCYLVKRPNNAPPINLVVQGQPTLRKIAWVPNSLNLVGFSLDRTNPPSFQTFFSGSAAHANNPIYRLQSDGNWGQIANLSNTLMRSGESFWIQSKGASDYQGPLAVSVVQRTGLTYSRSLVEQNIIIQNLSPNPKNLIFTVLPSGNPPGSSYAPLAGPVPLSYWKLDQINNVAGWFPVTNTMTQTNLGAGKTWNLRWEVRRPDMNPYSGAGNALYQSLLEIRDAAGSLRVVIPVTAQGLSSSALASPGLLGSPDGSALPLHPGLWIGSASINLVSQPASTSRGPTSTASPFQFRLIVHVDSTGQARLMQRIMQMWQNGNYMPDPNDPSQYVVDQPGRFILVTDESLISTIPNLTGALLRDGQPVGRRFSTAAFGFRSPIPMNGVGQFGVGSSVYSCQVVLDYDDPLNPFKHLYHPDHDNLDPRFAQKLPAGQESFTVQRQLQLQFTDSDPNNLALAGWGDNQIGGIYNETIIGLHKQPLYIQGTFRLTQASTVTGLNGNP